MDQSSLLTVNQSKVFLSIVIAKDMKSMKAKAFLDYDSAHKALGLRPGSLATVTSRWVDDKDLMTSLEYWRMDESQFVYNHLIRLLVSGDLPCKGYQGSKYGEEDDGAEVEDMYDQY